MALPAHLTSESGPAPGWIASWRRRWRRLFRRWKREDFVLGGRLALAALASMAAARTLGLHSFYWAGISAIVVSTGTPGGSFASSLNRVGGTLVGLAAGLGMVLLLGHSLTSAALAIPVAILACRALGLRAAVKVAALTTLFPVSTVVAIQPFGPTLGLALSRAANVLVGCAVTMGVDAFVWPERISRKFQRQMQVEIGRAGSLAADLLRGYAEGRAVAAAEDLAILQLARVDHLKLVPELAEEPDDPRLPKAFLSQRMAWVHELVDQCSALYSVVQRVDGDRVQELLRTPLTDLAEAIRDAGRRLEAGTGEVPEVAALAGCRERLEAAYQEVRGDQGTRAYPAPEVFRLLSVLNLGGSLAEGLARLGAAPPAEPA
jgi:uncharacterized membrane protein YccC